MSDVWVVSFPRSGNSFVALELLRAFPGGAYGLDPQYEQYERDTNAPVGGVQRVIDANPGLCAVEPTYRLVKTHDPPSVPANVPVVGIVRDGRDAMISYYHYAQPTEAHSKLEFWEGLRATELRWDQWHEKWGLWLHRRGALVLRYEHLFSFGLSEYERVVLSRLLGASCAAQSQLSMEELHEIDPNHFRRGSPGEWQDLPLPERLYLERELAPTLKRWGYGAQGYNHNAVPW